MFFGFKTVSHKVIFFVTIIIGPVFLAGPISTSNIDINGKDI